MVTQGDIHQLYPGYLPWGRECDPHVTDEESMQVRNYEVVHNYEGQRLLGMENQD